MGFKSIFTYRNFSEEKAMIDMEVKGIRRTVANISAFKNTEYKRAKNGMDRVVKIVERAAKKNVPVDKGRLQASIHGEVKGAKKAILNGQVSANTIYAAAVETMKERHPGAKAHASGRRIPYMYPAIQENFEEITRILRDALDI